MATYRSLTMAVRVDTSAMRADAARAVAVAGEMDQQLRKINENRRRYAKVLRDRGDLMPPEAKEQVKAHLAAMQERRATLEQAKEGRAALADRLARVKEVKEAEKAAAAQSHAVARTLADRRFAATHSQQQVELRTVRRHYAKLRVEHKDNAAMLARIDQTYAAERAAIERGAAGGRGGIAGLNRLAHMAKGAGALYAVYQSVRAINTATEEYIGLLEQVTSGEMRRAEAIGLSVSAALASLPLIGEMAQAMANVREIASGRAEDLARFNQQQKSMAEDVARGRERQRLSSGLGQAMSASLDTPLLREAYSVTQRQRLESSRTLMDPLSRDFMRQKHAAERAAFTKRLADEYRSPAALVLQYKTQLSKAVAEDKVLKPLEGDMLLARRVQELIPRPNTGQFSDPESRWRTIQSALIGEADTPKATLKEMRELRAIMQDLRDKGLLLRAG